MCWLCDHPDATQFDYLEHIRDIIACCCFAVQGVEGDRHHSPWAYTVGLTAHSKPELLVTGLSFARSARLLDDVASHVLHAEAPQPGEVVPLRGGPVIEIVEVTEPTVHLACNDAWITYTNRGSVQDETGTKDLMWLESAFLHKEAGEWKIRFLHSTRVP